MTDRSKGQPFDERAALDALEQFQSEIKRYRQERAAVTTDFEEFVRKLPPADEVFPAEKPSAPPAERPGIPPAAKPAAATSRDTPAQGAVQKPAAPASARPTASVPPAGGTKQVAHEASTFRESTPDVDRRPAKKPDAEPAPVLATPAPRSKVPFLAALLLVALVIAGAAYWNANRGEPSRDSAAGAPATETAPPETAAPVTPAPAPAPPAAPAAATGSEITTLRPVWVRVIADGERVVERELPAGAKIPFTVEKTVVIRAGDAGAVRLILRGADHGTLGGDGDVVTRTFTLPDDGH